MRINIKRLKNVGIECQVATDIDGSVTDVFFAATTTSVQICDMVADLVKQFGLNDAAADVACGDIHTALLKAHIIDAMS